MYMKDQIIILTPELSYTGTPESVLNMAVTFIKMGYFVTVASFAKGEKEKEFSGRGIHILYLNKKEVESKKFGKEVTKYKICIANTSMMAFQAKIIQKYIPTVLIIREAKSIAEFQDIFHTSISDICRVKIVYCVSEYAKQEIEKQVEVKPKILYNFVPDRYEKRKSKNKDTNMVKFAVIGTIEERKGIDICIEAFLKLSEQYDNCECHIVGRTLEWQSEYWKPLFEKICNNSSIFYHGEMKNREELIRFYEMVDVVVVASKDESCSLVALEAAMMSKVLIVSQNVGAKYVVKKVNGYVFATGNIRSLYDAMEKCIKNRKFNRIRGVASRYFYKKYASEKYYFKQLKSVLKDVQDNWKMNKEREKLWNKN